MKSRTHVLLVRVTLDRKCTARHAAREVKECLGGYVVYPAAIEKGDPETLQLVAAQAVTPAAIAKLRADQYRRRP